MSQLFVRCHAEHLPLVQTVRFEFMEKYCVQMMHLKAGETAATIGLGKAVLDFGYYNSYGTRIIALTGCRVVAVDLSKAGISEARHRGDKKSFC